MNNYFFLGFANELCKLAHYNISRAGWNAPSEEVKPKVENREKTYRTISKPSEYSRPHTPLLSWNEYVSKTWPMPKAP